MSFGSYLSNAWHTAWDSSKKEVEILIGETNAKIDNIRNSSTVQEGIQQIKGLGNKVKGIFQTAKTNCSSIQNSAIKCPADVPAAVNRTEVTIKSISGVSKFDISAEPAMPNISLKAEIKKGTEFTEDQFKNATFKWDLRIEFSPSEHTSYGRIRGNDTYASGDTYIDSLPSFSSHEDVYTPSFPWIRGGKMIVSLTYIVGGVELKKDFEGIIQGSNPDVNTVLSEIPGDVLKAIARQEGGRQFESDSKSDISMVPVYNKNPGDGGVGILQVTNPPPSPNDIWNWRSNIQTAVAIYNEKESRARAFAGLVRDSHKFAQVVNDYNMARVAKGKLPLTVTIREYTESELLDDTVRGYNGFSGKDFFIGQSHLHEFRIKLNDDDTLFVTNIDENTLRGETVWERVPISDRPRSGDPDYVTHFKTRYGL